MKDKLKVGLLIDSDEIPAWQCELIAKLRASEFASVQVVRVRGEDTTGDYVRWPLASLYRAAKWLTGGSAESADASERRAIASLAIADETVLDETTLASEGAAMLGVRGFDVIVTLCRHKEMAALSGVSESGAWFFRHGECQLHSANSGIVGLREVLSHEPFIRADLAICWHDQVLATAGTVSAVHYSSSPRTRSEHLWKLPTLALRQLRRLHNVGNQRFFNGLTASRPGLESRRPEQGLTYGVYLSVLLVRYFVWRVLLKLRRRIYSERWTLMYAIADEAVGLDSFRRIHAPAKRFWADPHIIGRNGVFHVFFEDASVRTGKGSISVGRMERGGRLVSPTRILERPYHLSYPFVFEFEQQTYLIPESAENRTIEVYRCRKFPHEWEFMRNLMTDVAAYDTTLLENKGLWWMFTNIREHPGTSGWDELFVFYCENPLTDEWKPHVLNPVVSDVRTARPAGRMFRRGSQLLRPSQDSTRRYGYALNFNRIDELTTETYRETLVQSIRPNRNRSIRGIHSFSQAEDVILVDAMYRTRR